MATSDRTILVLYGSETGNAQDLAEELGRLCQRLHFRVAVEELDAVDLSSLLQYQLVTFVISTTGQGDMPHNSLLFWKKLLRKKLPPGCLGQVKYTFFGLGDSTYVKFNWAARKLARRLDQLGATTFLDGFEADEQFNDGIEGSFATWAKNLESHLLEQHPLPTGVKAIPEDAILPPRWSLAPALAGALSTLSGADSGTISTPVEAPPTSGPPPPRALPIPHGWDATLVRNERLTPSTHWQDVRLVAFDIPTRPGDGPGSRLHCNPGDCLTVYPKNFPEDAQRLIALMGWESVADLPLDLAACPSLPRNLFVDTTTKTTTITIRDLLLHHVDFTSIPRRSFLRSMAHFAADPDQRERLLEFTSPEFLDEYFDYATRSRRSILEVLDEFTSVRLPADWLLDIFPLIRGRDFSIANGGAKLFPSSSSSPPPPTATRVELLVALVRYRTILRKPRQGLCSRYLTSLAPAASDTLPNPPPPLRVSLKPVLSPIHGPDNARRPLIAIATGTGIAPARSLIHERLTHPDPAPAYLFFGNRSRAADFFFEDEWSASVPNLTVFTAFSRDQPEKVYVQHLLRREAHLLAQLIPRNPIFTVCGGSSKMADACKEAVFEPFREGGDDKDERENMLASLTWWQEIW